MTVQLTNLHGDVVATADDSTTVSSIESFADSAEFALPVFTSTAYPRYGWLVRSVPRTPSAGWS
ncbi:MULTISPECIES: hypothetical protein [unclassified Frankia]|uniref:hypothetical protein n=1 Tax=unclassified Frankia TaxID=2632575 RepID=UPI001EF583EA|nr:MULTISPECIES: hypothetical protein [unclassified Frankia]